MARWTGPAQLEEVPDELREDETTGTLRLVVNKAARKRDDLASTEETVEPVLLPAEVSMCDTPGRLD